MIGSRWVGPWGHPFVGQSEIWRGYETCSTVLGSCLFHWIYHFWGMNYGYLFLVSQANPSIVKPDDLGESTLFQRCQRAINLKRKGSSSIGSIWADTISGKEGLPYPEMEIDLWDGGWPPNQPDQRQSSGFLRHGLPILQFDHSCWLPGVILYTSYS